MSKKILRITSVELELQKSNPPRLQINSDGEVPTGGWRNGKLIPYIYITPPADGIYEFDFIADPPTDTVIQQITPITAETFIWKDFPNELKGVKIYASENSEVTTIP